jgi:hypothetical protein
VGRKFALIIYPSSLQIYYIYPYVYPNTPASTGPQHCVIRPIGQYIWPWRIITVSVAQSATWSPTPSAREYPLVNLLIRVESTYGWPSNVLHHYTLQPNTSFSRTRAINTHNLPYHFPHFVRSIAAPVRIFAPTPTALGPYGTALWVDTHTEDYFMQPGQRLAGRLLGDAEVGMRAVDAPSEFPTEAMASTVYTVRAQDDWHHVALDEQEGRIAVGSAKGKILLLEYS